jgi:cerevisin
LHQISVTPGRFAGLSRASRESDKKKKKKEGFHGYVALMLASEAHALRRLEHVLSVEQDVRAWYAQEPADLLGTCSMQLDVPSWGLSKLSENPGEGEEQSPDSYIYEKRAGEGVVVYVLDTGLLEDHVEFEGRALFGADTVSEDPPARGGRRDVNGHGTHVAGICGGQGVGVAKRVRLVGVKMLDDEGEGAAVTALRALEWAMSDAEQRLQDDPRDNRTVINMSFRMQYSSAFNLAVQFAAEAAVLVAAAGNDGGDACTFSPASAAGVLSVAATTQDDALYLSSNVGACVQLLAPGQGIYSALGLTPYSYGLRSGTSQAAPHVSGAAALLWAMRPQWTAEQVRRALLQSARPRVVRDVPNGTANQMVHSSDLCGGGNISAWHGRSPLRFTAYTFADLWWQWLLFCVCAVAGAALIGISQRKSASGFNVR